VRRCPDPQAWAARPAVGAAAGDSSTRPFIMFLRVTRRCGRATTPGGATGFWRYLTGSLLQPDRDRFVSAATQLGFGERPASTSPRRRWLLIQTGARRDGLTAAHLEEPAAACRVRPNCTARRWRHHPGAIHAPRQVLFHLGVRDIPAVPQSRRVLFEQRMAAVAEPLGGAYVAYLHCKRVPAKPKAPFESGDITVCFVFSTGNPINMTTF
jgi:hypothetical protein